MNDERIEFLANSISSVCDVSDKKKLLLAISESHDVKDFLDDTKYVLSLSCLELLISQVLKSNPSLTELLPRLYYLICPFASVLLQFKTSTLDYFLPLISLHAPLLFCQSNEVFLLTTSKLNVNYYCSQLCLKSHFSSASQFECSVKLSARFNRSQTFLILH